MNHLILFFPRLIGFRILDEGQREVNIDNTLASRFKVCECVVLMFMYRFFYEPSFVAVIHQCVYNDFAMYTKMLFKQLQNTFLYKYFMRALIRLTGLPKSLKTSSSKEFSQMSR